MPTCAYAYRTILPCMARALELFTPGYLHNRHGSQEMCSVALASIHDIRWTAKGGIQYMHECPSTLLVALIRQHHLERGRVRHRKTTANHRLLRLALLSTGICTHKQGALYASYGNALLTGMPALGQASGHPLVRPPLLPLVSL